jgi:hypothetical protein
MRVLGRHRRTQVILSRKSGKYALVESRGDKRFAHEDATRRLHEAICILNFFQVPHRQPQPN